MRANFFEKKILISFDDRKTGMTEMHKLRHNQEKKENPQKRSNCRRTWYYDKNIKWSSIVRDLPHVDSCACIEFQTQFVSFYTSSPKYSV